MTFLHHSSNTETPPGSASTAGTGSAANHENVNNYVTPPESASGAGSARPAQGRRRLSLFSFGHGSSSAPSSAGENKNKGLPAISTSPSTAFNNPGSASAGKSPLMKSPSSSLPPTRQHSSASPAVSPVSETEGLSEKPDSHIFERSVQDMAGSVKQEDYIPPALDATASILSDSATDLDNIEMVYSSRRNSSVIGLNMALGRPYTPSRKNSVYSMSHLNNNGAHVASSSSLSYSQPFGGLNGFSTTSQPSSSQGPTGQQTQSPVSPPKLTSAKSSVSFYSYADMINNDEFSRRPSLMHAYSQGGVPTMGRKMSVTSNQSFGLARSGSDINKFPRKSPQQIASPSESQSQLSKQFKDRSHQSPPLSRTVEKIGEDVSPKKFLISPESSDSEDHDEIFHPASSLSRRPYSRRRSVASNASGVNSVNDNESFISSSVGDCIRQCTTEIENK